MSPSEVPIVSRKGLADDFFQPYKVAHFGVEAPIDGVARLLADSRAFFQTGSDQVWRLETDVAGEPRGELQPWVTVFQLRGHRWTQLYSDLRGVKSEHLLARHLSSSLDTRCISLGITDDAYYSHVLFNAGTLEELMVDAMDVDVVHVARQLDLPVPEQLEYADPDDLMTCEDHAVFGYRRDGRPPHSGAEVGRLVADLGCYLHTTYLPQELVYGLHGLDPSQLVRMDVIPDRL